jgi:nitrite reductase/ring-hydroxylating ferredoxin subunit/uncharacterized membrane protein
MDKKDIKDFSDVLDNQEWLGPIAEGLQNTVTNLYDAGGAPAQKIKNALHGTWLGHPLHPVMTDIPIGAWTAALVFDAVDAARGRDDFAQASDLAVGVGLVGAIGAAKTGLTDYASSGEQSPNAGLVHGALNITATTLYAASLILRRKGNRSAGRVASLLGYGVLSAAAYLGGELVYSQRIGVDHAQREHLPGKWTPVLPKEELEENKLTRAEAGGIRVLLLKRGKEIFAIGEVCSHLGGPLAEGELNCDGQECSVTCPWHGSRFDLKSGGVLDGPATYRQPQFETRVRAGQIEVRAAKSRASES